tara:strand:- start:56 stop:571 length:516 start_codon:yes stop_codon:yes gene_type:complete
MEATERYLHSWATDVVRMQRNVLRTKNKIASGKLAKSLRYKVSQYVDGYMIEFFMAPHGKFVDKGVRGKKVTRTYIDITGKRKRSPYRYKSKQPPTKVFDKWMIKRGIAPRDKSGKFVSRQSIKFLIARSIFFKGIKATSFFSKPLSLKLKTFGKGMLDAITKDIEDNLFE